MTYVTIYTDARGGYHTAISDFLLQPGGSPDFLPGGSQFHPARTFVFPDPFLAAAFHAGIGRLPQSWLDRLVVFGLPEKTGPYHPLNGLPSPV